MLLLKTMSDVQIHPTAIVDPGARIGTGENAPLEIESIARPRNVLRPAIPRHPGISVMLEELNSPFMRLRRIARLERAEVAALARARILLTRVEPVLARLQFPDHGEMLCKVRVHY